MVWGCLANFDQIHFQYSSDAGSKVGDAVGKATVAAFDKSWDKF